ncbi:reverse transcriptase domain-containing protein [Tanacetum coccineum]
MERGFVSSSSTNKKDAGEGMTKKDSLFCDLASKITNIDGKIIGKDGKPLRSVRRVVFQDPITVTEVNKADVAEVSCNEACVKDPNSDADGIMNNPMQRSFIEVVSPGSADKQRGSEVPKQNVNEEPVVAKRVNFRALINKEQVANNDTVLPKAAMEDVKSRYDNTLIGYFVGKSLAFSIVQTYVKNTWAKFGLSKLMKTDNGVFLFKFETKGGMDQVLERGPWLIRNTPLILNKWSPNSSLKPDEVSKVPVWVKLYNVPVVAYSDDGLSLIATQIGKPIMLDAFTSSMCVDSWGRISFARALIEIHADSELKKEVRMAIPVDDDDDGTDYTSEVIRVEYEWTPPHCLDCKLFGHNSRKCPKKVCEPEVVDNSDKNNDGFTDVVNRKNKGNKVANQMPKNQIAGIQFHKPKLSFYRPINKQVNDKQTKKKSAANDKASTSHSSGEKKTAHVDGDAQNLKSGTEEAVKEQQQDNLWSKFKAAKEASKNNPRSSPVVEDSEEDEVYCSNVEYTSRVGSGFSMDEDDLDSYDGYEAQVYDIPERLQTYCDGFDIRLNSRGTSTFQQPLTETHDKSGSSSYMNNRHTCFVGQGFNLLLFVQKLNERPVHVTLDTAHAPCTELGRTSGKKILISTAINDVDEKGLRHMVLCRVILGNVELIQSGSKQFYLSGPSFDSGVDDLQTPNNYLIWNMTMNTHISSLNGIQQDSKASRVTSLLGSSSSKMGKNYPQVEDMNVSPLEKVPSVGSSAPRDPNSPWMSFSELIEAVYDKVAPNDMRLIHVFYESFRAKKMNTDEFIRKLRLVVGD